MCCEEIRRAFCQCHLPCAASSDHKLHAKNLIKKINGIFLVARALEKILEAIVISGVIYGLSKIMINILLNARTLVQEVVEVAIVTWENPIRNLDIPERPWWKIGVAGEDRSEIAIGA